MLVTLIAVFLVAILVGFVGKRLTGLWGLLSVLPLSLFIYFLRFIPAVSSNSPVSSTYDWVPSLGVQLDFYLDGLALLFVLLITGVGFLVFLYTSNYLKGHPYLHRFYSYLLIFMGAMLGLVLADNLILLFIFWELTSISSFFLIGFNNEKASSRKSALIALAITALGGLFLLVAVLLLGNMAGSFSLQELMENPSVIVHNGVYYSIVLCLFIAAFTKSAQFPFHFWLPGAMDAPTPVSTYLHSATMVKAGIFILLRFSPILGDSLFWNVTLISVGGITMLYAALQVFYKTDLKNILAYSTIAALGILVFLTGIGTAEALLAAVFFILIHALYKAALFLITGIIDYSTGSRDSTRLYGLAKFLWPTAIAGFLAALSNGGVPPSFGFVGKDLAYAATTDFSGNWSTVLTLIALVSNVILFYVGYVVGVRPFFKKAPVESQPLEVKKISPLLWLPPMLLGLTGLTFGLFPKLIHSWVLQSAYGSVTQLYRTVEVEVWPGFNLILLLSVLTIAAGVGLCYFIKPSKARESYALQWENWSPKGWFEQGKTRYFQVAGFITHSLQNGNMRRYIHTIIIASIFLISFALKFTWSYEISNNFEGVTLLEFVILIVLFAVILKSVYTQSRLTAIVAMSIVGYAICLIYVFYSAPDLAMTQFSIDTLTVILFVLILHRLPKYLTPPPSLASRWRDGVLSGIFGLLIMWVTLEVSQTVHSGEVSSFYTENAYKLGRGKNVVNVILVDFRGFDTFMEITVLTIAAIGVFSLSKFKLSSKTKA